MNYGGERCMGSNNDLNGTEGIASVSVGGDVERARKEDGLYG